MHTKGKWRVAKANKIDNTPLYICAEWLDEKKRRNTFIITDRFSEHPEHSHTANAERICHCVNLHDELVEACACIVNARDRAEPYDGMVFQQALNNVENAYAKAKGE